MWKPVKYLAILLVIGLTTEPTNCKMRWWWARIKASPVVFIPGMAGNQLHARINKESSQLPHCPKQSDWFRIWLDLWRVLRGQIDCLSENLQLFYNSTLKQSFNAPGVEFKVRGFGTTETVEYLDPSLWALLLGNIGVYAEPLIRELKQLGLASGRGIRAAPYDFRFAPHSMRRYFFTLRLLIEDTYKRNDRRKVAIIAHSMGGLYGLYFLNKQPQAWKDKYIKAFICMGTPWRGSVLMAHIFASGRAEGIKAKDALRLRDLQRSYETALLLLPRENPWPADKLLISTPDKNYTIADYDAFFADLNYTMGTEKRNHVLRQTYTTSSLTKHPGIPFYCFYGTGVPTPDYLLYGEGEFPDHQPDVVMGDGDKTVNLESLRACSTLFENDTDYGHMFHQREFPGVTHQGVFTDCNVYKVIKDIVTEGF